MPDFRFRAALTALLVGTLGVACSAPSSDEASASTPEPPADAWAETKSTLGVTYWASSSSNDPADESAEVIGYDDAHEIRARFVVDQTQDDDGNVAVRIRSLVQGPAVLEFRPLPERGIAVLKDTFRDSPDAQKAFALAAENLKAQTGRSDGPLTNVSSQSLRTLDNGPLIGNQEQLICRDGSGRACTAPPGAGQTAFNCLVAAGGAFGLGCLVTGAETIGVGCVISAGAAVLGGLSCANDVSQRASCTCVTPCAEQCRVTFNRQYACPTENTTPCSNAAANDRIQEASCVRGCGG